jgi:hypothetical protein
MLISEVLELAANEYLWCGDADDDKPQFICNAIHFAANDVCLRDDAIDFLVSLGMTDLSGGGFYYADDSTAKHIFCDGAEQQVRYAWLMFAADRAREQGR